MPSRNAGPASRNKINPRPGNSGERLGVMRIEISPFESGDIETVVDWNRGTGSEFLSQWAGTGYSYPLTRDQIWQKMSRLKEEGSIVRLFRIDADSETGKRMIGTVELNEMGMPRKSAMVCRFLISPRERGMGYGTIALSSLTDLAFSDYNYKMLRLKVFVYNKPAIRCYEKAGYKIVGQEIWTNGLSIYEMEIKKKPGNRAFPFWCRALAE
jgi:RimJ/RimL family protein N-acetyltransferase